MGQMKIYFGTVSIGQGIPYGHEVHALSIHKDEVEASVRYRADLYFGNDCKELRLRHDLLNLSPTLCWGFDANPPTAQSQLALALIADATGDDKAALSCYQQFATQYITHLDKTLPWVMCDSMVRMLAAKILIKIN